MWKEFREFIARGNVIDLAIGVIIGGAFTTIVNSLVTDIVMPILGVFTGRLDFSSLYINLSGQEFDSLAAAEQAGAAVIKYGSFINSIINFLIIAYVIFLLVRAINRFNAQQEAAPAAAAEPSAEVKLLSEIRDLLKK